MKTTKSDADLRDDIMEMISRREESLARGGLTVVEQADFRRELADLYECLRENGGR